jgi:membrane protease YdiL (CAAX protease family)
MLGIVLAPILFKSQAAALRPMLGLERVWPKWLDAGLALMGVVVSLVLGAIALTVAAELFPALDLAQEQDLGVVSPTGFELGFVLLLFVVIGPVVEELIFRGYMYGQLRKLGVNIWVVTLVVSLVFGLVHLQWNVGITVFVLSIAMCIAREVTGSLWAPVLMHMLKNGTAAYLLYFTAFV